MSEADNEEFEERAAILEYEYGMTRQEAEVQARFLLKRKNEKIYQDRIISIAMNLAEMKTKHERVTETARLKSTLKADMVEKILGMAKKLYEEKA